ncbi:chromobox protein homolog 1 [Diabrotica virgifera virgifera]|uniref:Chromobox protein homolog 1-like n=1 Tax=Diabrotica virgifera virgifera TaxID=50390 RepID=A0A6P7GM20_DIAVI|nr:chromobox protein homolog 1 [Diabrotica virgifera virgifera]
MKRRGVKKAQKAEDDSNGVEDFVEKNGGASDVEDESDEQPKDKKRKSKSNRKSASPSKKTVDESMDEADPLEDVEEVKKPKEKTKKSKAVSEDEDEDGTGDETQYEVEKVLDDKMIAGVRHYLIRWKGYGQGDDTWEPEDTLNCPDAIKAFKDAKKKTKKVKKDAGEEWDENEDFEVSRILEVHHNKNGKREFLVSWKGFSPKDNSWEPEENMDCKDLIEKFMKKVDKAKDVDERELRVNRKHVQRLTYNTPDTSRRLSRRMSGKERVQYHDAE